MFEDSLIESGGQLKSKKGATVMISGAVHIALVAVLILIPLISYSELPQGARPHLAEWQRNAPVAPCSPFPGARLVHRRGKRCAMEKSR